MYVYLLVVKLQLNCKFCYVSRKRIKETKGKDKQVFRRSLAGLSLYLAFLDYILMDAVPALLSTLYHLHQPKSLILPRRSDLLGPTPAA